MDLAQQGNQVTGSLRYNISPEFFEIIKTWETSQSSNFPEFIKSVHDRLMFTVSGTFSSGGAPPAAAP
jgi:hypothetical protein